MSMVSEATVSPIKHRREQGEDRNKIHRIRPIDPPHQVAIGIGAFEHGSARKQQSQLTKKCVLRKLHIGPGELTL